MTRTGARGRTAPDILPVVLDPPNQRVFLCVVLFGDPTKERQKMKRDYHKMIEDGVSAFDGKGVRIPAVRSVEEVEGGINVAIIVKDVKAGLLTVDADNEVVEFSAFVKGGSIGPRPE